MAIVLCPAPSLSVCALLSAGEMGEEVLYGTQNGRVGLVQVGPEEPLYRWDLDNEKREGGEGRWGEVEGGGGSEVRWREGRGGGVSEGRWREVNGGGWSEGRWRE